jgi:hypothetical protein
MLIVKDASVCSHLIRVIDYYSTLESVQGKRHVPGQRCSLRLAGKEKNLLFIQFRIKLTTSLSIHESLYRYAFPALPYILHLKQPCPEGPIYTPESI